MFLVDDILLFPMRSMVWIFREIHNAGQEELAHQSDSVTAELSSLYMRLETGKITEEEFAEEEKILLERLDSMQDRDNGLQETRGGDEKGGRLERRRVA